MIDGCNCRKKTEGCFPADSKVSLGGGETVKMSQLQVGDKVQTGMKYVINIQVGHG